jgi:hypothetical protein
MWLFHKQIISSRILLIVFLLLAIAVVISACMFLINPYVDRELSGPVTLTQEWMEFTPKEPLKAERDTQEIALLFDPPVKINPPIRTSPYPEDVTYEIEAELVDSNDVTHRSRPGYSASGNGDSYIRYSVGFNDLPKNVTYRIVRIRSRSPYPVQRILFRCYNWRDVHRK